MKCYMRGVSINSLVGLLAKGGVIFGLFLTLFSASFIIKQYIPTLFTFVFGYSIFFLLSCIYFLSQKRQHESTSNIRFIDSTVLNTVFLSGIYIVILGISSSALYLKPLLYFVLFALAITIIGLEILYSNSLESNIHLILILQIFPLAIISRISTFLINPIPYVGIDVPWHYSFIDQLTNQGYISESAFHYYYYPFYHIQQSIGNSILIPSIQIFNLINVTILIVAILIPYLIGTRLFNERIGLLCSLLMLINTMYFDLTVNTSKIGGIVLLFLMVYLLIKYQEQYKKTISWLIWLTGIGIFFWHPEISLALLLLFISFSVIQIIYRHDNKSPNKIIYITLIYGSFFFIYLMYELAKTSKIWIFDLFLGNLSGSTMPAMIQFLPKEQFSYNLIIQLFLNYFGITILVFFAVYMAFHWLSQPQKLEISLLGAIILFHLSPLLSLLTGNFSMNPERSFTYISTFLTFIAAGGIFYIFSDKKIKNILAFTVLLFVIAFLSSSSYLIGDSDLPHNNQIPKQTVFLTNSNMAIADFIDKLPADSKIVSDVTTIKFVVDPVGGVYVPHSDISYFPDIPTSGIFIINRMNLNRMKWDSYSWGRELRSNLKNKNIIYNNGYVSILNSA